MKKHYVMSEDRLKDFITESNRIERIGEYQTFIDYPHYWKFIHLTKLSLDDVREFVYYVSDGAPLRTSATANVRVGNHIPPAGGYHIAEHLDGLLRNMGDFTPYQFHCKYEALHPFMDGNGRSGRVIWLWQMLRTVGGREAIEAFGFLKNFYYQSLENNQG